MALQAAAANVDWMKVRRLSVGGELEQSDDRSSASLAVREWLSRDVGTAVVQCIARFKFDRMCV